MNIANCLDFFINVFTIYILFKQYKYFIFTMHNAFCETFNFLPDILLEIQMNEGF